jgi:recombination associated protein RdgC
MGETPSRSAIRRLKEETRDELLPKALLKSDRIQGFFILSERILGIDTTSESRAELFIDQLRASLEGFEFSPLNYNQHPGDLLTGMFLGDVPPNFALGRECRMQDISEKKSTGTWRDVELSDAAIRQHVIDGMQLTHLGVEYAQVMSCVISADGTLSKLKFIGVEAADNGADEDALAQQDAEFVLLTGTLRALIIDLKKLLGGYLSEESERVAA